MKTFIQIVCLCALAAASVSCGPAGVPNGAPAVAVDIEKIAPDRNDDGVTVAADYKWAPSKACVDKAGELVGKMTLRQKAGQMTQVAVRYVKDLDDLATYNIGSMLAGGTDFPGEDLSAGGWVKYIDDAKQRALKNDLGIPLLFAIDAVHGNGKSTGAVVFPHNIGLGCTGDPAITYRAAVITALETLGSGVDWAFTPVLAAALDERWGRTYEAFGETADLAQEHGVAAVLGLQGPKLGSAYSALASVKHFAGDGATSYGTSHMGDGAVLDRGNAPQPWEEFYDIAVRQYIPSINAGAGTVMISYSSYHTAKMHGEKNLITNVLKGDLGFKGFVVSDWKGIDDIPGPFETDVEVSINAGIDMVMVPDRYKEFIAAIEKLVPERIPQERVDDAVQRILQIKCEMGMLDDDYSPVTPKELTDKVGSSEHRAVAREAVSKSLVLLKNDGVLPIGKRERIHVAGSGAKSLTMQCGGWTVTWGGEGDRTEGTTVLEALQNVNPNVTFSRHGDRIPARTKLGVVVVGEPPYAEWRGDREELVLDQWDTKTIENFKSQGVPFVVILFSGRPMIITEELDASSGFIAAWLPGTEGDGIADVLFGDVPPTGKLSHSWPRSMDQIPVNLGDDDYDPLFPFGFGLTYE